MALHLVTLVFQICSPSSNLNAFGGILETVIAATNSDVFFVGGLFLKKRKVAVPFFGGEGEGERRPQKKTMSLQHQQHKSRMTVWA